MIVNPVLPGFHPDPSICRAKGEYYIATSTFQWWPAVRLHQSKDLVHWSPHGYALDRLSQIDLLGNEDCSGVWAPCLSYADGQFYLVYANVRSWTGAYKDVRNYLVTAPAIDGPWSEPVFLNGTGFDASLFHDEDGTKWLLNMEWDFRAGKHPFAGIVVQQYDTETKRLVGPVRKIFSGTHHRLVEGPHLYKYGGYYVLLTAEGGTGWDHVQTVARSKDLFGPYEVMPRNPLITSKDDVTLPLQRAGHGSLVETEAGQWYLAHLCGRPVMPQRRCILGRETALQAITWDQEGWPRLLTGGSAPAIQVPAPDLPPFPWPADAKRVDFFDDFDGEKLHPEFNTLRGPASEDWLTQRKRPGHLRMVGRESLYSKHHQSLVARRIPALELGVSTAVDFEPDHFQQMAGLIFYYDCSNHHYLALTHNGRERCLRLITAEGGNNVGYSGAEISLGPGAVELRGELRYGELRFLYRQGSASWAQLGPVLDATVLSDEYKAEVKFTGAFAGICVQDMTGRAFSADFDWFRMEPLT